MSEERNQRRKAWAKEAARLRPCSRTVSRSSLAVWVFLGCLCLALAGCKDGSTGPKTDPNAVMFGTYMGLLYRVDPAGNRYTDSLVVSIASVPGGYAVGFTLNHIAQITALVSISDPTVRFMVEGEQAPPLTPATQQRGLIEATRRGDYITGTWQTLSYGGFRISYLGYWEAVR